MSEPPKLSPQDKADIKSATRGSMLIIAAVAVFLLGGTFLVEQSSNQPNVLAKCSEEAFSQALNKLSRSEGTRLQLASSNSFRCEKGFAAVKVASETAPGSGTLTDLDPALMLFVSESGAWQRQSIKTDCAQIIPESIYEIACN